MTSLPHGGEGFWRAACAPNVTCRVEARAAAEMQVVVSSGTWEALSGPPAPSTPTTLHTLPLARRWQARGIRHWAASGAPAAAAAAVGAAAAALGPRRRREARCNATSVRASGNDLSFGLEEELTVSPPKARRRTGVLLLNIGTPASTSVEDVREYLSRFLADDRVIEIQPSWLKAILLQILLATRPQNSAENYKKVWDSERGSPLLFHSEDLASAIQRELGSEYLVRIGMAYSEPFVGDAIKSLAASGVDDVALVPMFPHFASSTTGSILANAYRTAAEEYCTPFLKIVPPFYDHPKYLAAMRQLIGEFVGPRGQDVDHLLFSFHGLPEAQCSKTDDTGGVCLRRPNCCGRLTRANRNCYRAQCFETARLLAKELDLEEGSWSIGFQSRLTLRGTIQWIRPYTDEAIVRLAEDGVRRLAIVAPSFTADCVETLEELGITGREEFEEAGGQELVVVPCLNSTGAWTQALSDIVREQLAGRVDPPREAVAAAVPESGMEVAPVLQGTPPRTNGTRVAKA
uniref:Ferrochelatase n=1 Tax=Alexandrium monilatum TaxID=311494 RepID=A0A7S4T1B9_9DINO